MEKKKTVKKYLPYVIIAILLFLLIGFAVAYLKKPVEEPVSEVSPGNVIMIDDRSQDKSEIVKKNPLAGRNVYFAGYVDATLNSESIVQLENLPDNQEFLLRYIILNKDTEEEVFSTDYIESGKCVIWNPYETLGTGTYHLKFIAKPCYVDVNGNSIDLTAGSTDVTYIIQ